jgi:bifunctional DNA-binding transcriptional regulator/antitoxin component of YhaV-PrlF toxin-antitoxin module
MPEVQGMSNYRVRVTDDWLPIPAAALAELGWAEGDTIEIEVIDDTVVLTWIAHGPCATLRPAPSKGRHISAT